MIETGYSIGQVARSAGVTVRALRHYESLGLLRPSGRRESGYRQYAAADLERLQRILLYRQVGLPLETVKKLLDDPNADPLDHLRRQHALLNERIAALQRMAATVEKMMEARVMGVNLDPEDMLEVFGDHDPNEYQEEAEENWGETDAWAESRRRIATYTKADWLRQRAEYGDLVTRIAAAQSAGQPATSAAAMDLAEEHRVYLERWFYTCPYPMHRGLGEMYVNDPRFAANYEKVAAGLATYFRDAIRANADRHAA